MYLKNRAGIWFKNLQNNQKNNLQNFKTVFDDKFLSGESKYSAQQALYARKQLPGEAPETYIEDVLIKADMLGWQGDQTLQHLIGGLQESLKPYVIMANPTTLEATCDTIMRAHNANKSNLLNQGLPGIQSALTEILTQVKADKKPACATVDPAPVDPPQPQYIQQPPPYVQPPPAPRRPRRNPMPQQPITQPPIIINAMQPQQQMRGRPRFPRRFPQQNRQQQTGGQPDVNNPCFICGSPRHWKNECPQAAPPPQRNYRPGFQRRQGPNGFQSRQPRPIFRRQENY